MSMKRRLRFFLLTLVCVFALQNVLYSFNNHVAQAAGPKVEYLGNVSYSYYTVGKFKVDGEYAFCVDHKKSSPPTGSSYSGGSVYNNESIRAILYYGYGGDGNIVGNGDAGLVATSLALDSIMNGDYSSGKSTVPGYDKLMDHASKKDAPSTSASFSKSEVKTSISGNLQKSETIKFNADEKNSIKVNVPSGVTLHLGNKSYTNKAVTIKGGQSFYLTAGLDYGKDVSFSNIKPSMGTYQSILFVPSSSSQQRLAQGLVKDPVSLKKLTVDFEVRQKKITVQHIDKHTNKLLSSSSYTRNIGSSYDFSPKNSIVDGENKYLPVDKKSKSGKLGNSNLTLKFYYNLERTITVRHIDARDNRLITSNSYKKLRGETYSYGPKTNLKKGSYTYRPLSKDKKTGTVGANNITLDFYYDVPLIKAGLEKIQVYTAPANKGLPVKVDLSKENIYPASNGDMNDAKLDVSLYQGSTKVDTKTYTAKSLPEKIDFKVPASRLSVNQKRAYTVKLEGYSKDEIDVISNAASITTDGYTSSQKTLNVSDTSLSFTGVIMTERAVGKNMVVFNETLQANLKKLDKKLTGYGFEYPVDIVYRNDLEQKINSKFEIYVPKSLVDSYLSYPVSNDCYKIRFDETNQIESKNQKVLTTTKRFELPEVNIEKRTGHLFTSSQVADGDSRIKHEIIDGGRKFYTPIWGDLGTYQLEVKNVEPLGVHKINVSIKQNLDIYAYMYGHMDSKTGKQDAIYLRPINADDPNYPANWTAEDKRRFEEWSQN
ncbi:thioester domain-containing protein [Bacillus massiliglaciei]|uniref:thioester domain-containing protein n=1 Tax=Bacillus massiliglaciei TaxID=1816693 RepID=UPI0018FF040D|nr:thioester domain-containing protein [Bacillus massiliglaciei]